MPVPELSTPVIVAAGGAVTILGYSGQTAWLNRRARRRAAGGGTGGEQRLGPRATEVGGATAAEISAELAASIDVLVSYIDGLAGPVRAQAAARRLAQVIPEQRWGELLRRFFQQVSVGTLESIGTAAEEACLQMAVELRAMLARAEAEREFVAPRPMPRRR